MKWGDQRVMVKPAAISASKANALLGGPFTTEAEIKAAFAEAVKAEHPDANSFASGLMIGELQAARDLLLHSLNQGQEIACKVCGGSGRVGTGFGSKCTACKGEGIIRG